MNDQPNPTRRTALAAGAGILCAGTLAGCGGGTKSTTSSPRTDSPHAGQQTPPAQGGAGAGAPELTALDKVPVGGAVKVASPAGPAIVAQPTAGQVVAFSAHCTHRGVVVDIQGSKLVCPAHKSTFDALTGKRLSGPATNDLPAIPVKVSDGEVVIG